MNKKKKSHSIMIYTQTKQKLTETSGRDRTLVVPANRRRATSVEESYQKIGLQIVHTRVSKGSNRGDTPRCSHRIEIIFFLFIFTT